MFVTVPAMRQKGLACERSLFPQTDLGAHAVATFPFVSPFSQTQASLRARPFLPAFTALLSMLPPPPVPAAGDTLKRSRSVKCD